ARVALAAGGEGQRRREQDRRSERCHHVSPWRRSQLWLRAALAATTGLPSRRPPCPDTTTGSPAASPSTTSITSGSVMPTCTGRRRATPFSTTYNTRSPSSRTTARDGTTSVAAWVSY